MILPKPFPLWPVYIPSKGRPKPSAVTDELIRGGYEVYTMVEPQDASAYRAHYQPIIKLEANDQGIGYVRNTIIDLARMHAEWWFWMLDDDLSAFYANVEGRKPFKVAAAQALAHLQKQILLLKSPTLAQAAAEYQQFAWSGNGRVTRNSYCDCVVAMHADRIGSARYAGKNMPLKEDRDFTLQLLANGRETVRFSSVGFKCPKNGSNKGGLYEVYQTKVTEDRTVDHMVKRWPGIVSKQVKKDGRIDCKINWKAFKS